MVVAAQAEAAAETAMGRTDSQGRRMIGVFQWKRWLKSQYSVCMGGSGMCGALGSEWAGRIVGRLDGSVLALTYKALTDFQGVLR